jgi:hypothetical protein
MRLHVRNAQCDMISIYHCHLKARFVYSKPVCFRHPGFVNWSDLLDGTYMSAINIGFGSAHLNVTCTDQIRFK